MKYLTFDVGQSPPGTAVEVSLSGSESDVFLVDDNNLRRFKRGDSFNYAGGHYKQSPIVLRTPDSGNWTVVVVPNGRVTASVRILG